MSDAIKSVDRSKEIGEAILNDPILKELYRLKCKFMLTYKIIGLLENGTISLFISDKDQELLAAMDLHIELRINQIKEFNK